MKVDIDKFFASVLKRKREALGITQDALAMRSELDRTYISMLERGLRKPSLQTVFSLAKSLEIEVTELIREVENDWKTQTGN
ncbi:MAG: helix-turn-helix transcriptional regulator [Pseudomonadota bacterium]